MYALHVCICQYFTSNRILLRWQPASQSGSQPTNPISNLAHKFQHNQVRLLKKTSNSSHIHTHKQKSQTYMHTLIYWTLTFTANCCFYEVSSQICPTATLILLETSYKATMRCKSDSSVIQCVRIRKPGEFTRIFKTPTIFACSKRMRETQTYTYQATKMHVKPSILFPALVRIPIFSLLFPLYYYIWHSIYSNYIFARG